MGTPTYEAIATFTIASGGSTVASFTFSSIPQTYTNLVLVGDTVTGAAGDIRLTATNASAYVSIVINSGTSGTPTIANITGAAQLRTSEAGNGTGTDTGSVRIEFLNYSLTSRHKPILYRIGRSGRGQANGSGMFEMTSGAAITSFTITSSGGNFAAPTTFTLYGIA